MKKKELRILYKEKRKALTENQIKDFQDNIYKQVFFYDFSLVNTVHIFLPITHQKEINTYPIINYLRNKGKLIIVSKSCFKTNTLAHYIFDEDTKVVTNKYGIPEPVAAKKVEVQEIDLVFVPMLISDERGYRVGYGKGFYDRFLSECKKNIKTIGLNLFIPISSIEDVNAYDIALDKIIYPLT